MVECSKKEEKFEEDFEVREDVEDSENDTSDFMKGMEEAERRKKDTWEQEKDDANQELGDDRDDGVVNGDF
ncbi:MAG: hypothetical protein GOV00_03820 [Candidatus Altiarchaeota archaeon]|nr:hypothetical protein [Candidatus Altiarchaeota archaeon]